MHNAPAQDGCKLHTLQRILREMTLESTILPAQVPMSFLVEPKPEPELEPKPEPEPEPEPEMG